MSVRYVELQTTSNFSFLRGASHPWELVLAAKALGHGAIGLADRNTLAGVVRAWRQGQDIGQRTLSGCRLDFMDGAPSVLVYPADREAWGRLTRLLTLGQRRAPKGECHLTWTDLLQHAEGQLMLAVPPAQPDEGFEATLRSLAGDFGGQVWLAAARPYAAQDQKRLAVLDDLARRTGAPMVATNDVLYHGPERRPLQDVLTCIREKCSIQEAGLRLEANAERHLKPAAEMARLFAAWPGAVERSAEIADRIDFDLSQLKYEYPDEPVPPGRTAMEHLTILAREGARWRYPQGVPDKVTALLDKELALIEELAFPNYFLTVHDVVKWARGQGILCQGRGSAANSSVCFCLGVTAVDPCKEDHDVLFERFISRERDEPPDIDVDFEHERREKVMQYVYERYGRHRAAIVATVIHYRPRSAIRDVGKALGLTEDVTAALASTVWGSWGEDLPDDHIRQVGLDPENPQIKRATALATILLGFPRHLSQHVGGYVLTKRRLDETVPIGNAAMEDRTFIEWDKDDIDALKLMKVDILALGMLTAIKRAMTMLAQDHGLDLDDMADIPEEAPEVYDMLCKADSVGVFQVESRAQMSMLPRLKPRKFYDLVIEVAIVRPGPIQGNMVHPYLKRRDRIERVTYPRPSPEHGPPDELENVLRKTLGVPLFQEQAMNLAMTAAKFTPEEANGLRRSMATFRNLGTIGEYGDKFVSRLIERGYDREFAAACFEQIKGFGSYGFPESHAVSFAKLVYVSAWIKCFYPDVFLAALLNSQPMGFYQPAQLVRDAREHGVTVLPPDILHSDWDTKLEASPPPSPPPLAASESPTLPAARAVPPHKGEGRDAPAPLPHPVRLGFSQIGGLNDEEVQRLVAARRAGARTLPEIAVRAQLSPRALELLAEADALRSLGMDRREALWAVKALAPEVKAEAEAPLLALMGPQAEAAADLPVMSLPAHVHEDYRTLGLSLKAHPCQFFREQLRRMGVTPAAQLGRLRNGARVTVAGLVLVRQRPGTAKGVIFLTLEDETGPANAVVWRDVFQSNRRQVMSSAFLVVHGRLQIASDVIHVVAERFTDLSDRLAELKADVDLPPPSATTASPRMVRSRDFH
ncbi:error-prone DNA polymerase [Caulobacter sp. KR2-114]|uniref:error-prone DNA polymerase n=1 Tax=Caulobacter sp. KR2-114 TaxID=3400912 RepID=UPI003C0E7B53